MKRYETLRANGATEAQVEQLMAQEQQRQVALLAKSTAPDTLGYYEGANGYAKGVYRSGINCIMFSLQTQKFCGACNSAIGRMIDSHISS